MATSDERLVDDAAGVPVETWYGCYDGSWHGLIVEEAFAHPAKMSRALLVRIFTHLLREGWLKRGDVVVDPFGGIGSTGIEAALRGVQAVCCELEPKFVELATTNYYKHLDDWRLMGVPIPKMILGDSRHLRRHLAEVLQAVRPAAVIASPPYVAIATGAGGLNTRPPRHEGDQSGRSALSPSQSTDARYGEAEGQLARMAVGEVDAVLSSPPFLDARSDTTGSIKGGTAPTAHDPEEMGHSAGNINDLPSGDVDAVISSPPFPQPYTGGGGINVKGYGADGADKVGARTYQALGGDRAEGNLETLKVGDVDAVLGSPPWGNDATGAVGADKWAAPEDFLKAGRGHGASDEARLAQLERDTAKVYGDSAGQVGNTSGETFWSAAKQIVEECYALLKPGGVAVWVVKPFVKDKRIVDFPGDWCRLCEAVGFVPILEVQASLVAEHGQADMFSDTVKRTERKSFFRRLAERRGSPRIDHETVWFMRKQA